MNGLLNGRVKLILLSLGVMFISQGCCTIEGWLGWNRYTVGVKTDKDANYNGSTNLLMVWPGPEQTFELSEIKTYWKAKSWAEQQSQLGFCTYVELGDYKRGAHTDPLLEKPEQVKQCGANQLFVFSTMEDAVAGEGGVINNRVRQISLTDPLRPVTNFIHIHVKHQDFDVKFYDTPETLLFYTRKKN